MSGPLHLLRPFTEWSSGETVDAAERWIASLPPDGEFATWTRRPPAHLGRLEGGSVYFCRRGETLFRMPFIRLTRHMFAHRFAILMETRLIRVERAHVGRVRGWRYLADADAPADLATNDDAPLRAELKALGLG